MSAAAICLAIVATFGVAEERACPAADAIVAEAGEHDPLLLAALFAPESGFDFRKVNPRSGACGIGQVLYSKKRAVQARRCRRVLADLHASTRAAVARLEDAVEFCVELGGRPVARRHGLTACTVAGYIAGPRGVRSLGKGNAQIRRRVQARIASRDRLRAALGPRPGPAPVVRPAS